MTEAAIYRRQMHELAKDIPVVLLAGGLGTRLSEETQQIPKPMVRIGDKPIVLHIMDYYASFGFRNFVLCGGYKIDALKDFFVNLPRTGKDVEISFSDKSVVATQSSIYEDHRRDWRVTILETGLHSMTGFRIARALDYMKGKGFKRFALTYGDGLTDADLHKELAFHFSHKRIGTVLGVHQPTRFGIFKLDSDGKVKNFSEKPQFSNEFINGGYFFFENALESFIDTTNDQCIFEQTPLVNLSRSNELFVHRHEGFWQCMDTMREKMQLDDLARSGKAPWLRSMETRE